MRRKICGDKEREKTGEIEFISILTFLSARGRETERLRESRNGVAITVTYNRFYHTLCAQNFRLRFLE
jgi:hypothetical protein